MKTHIFNNSFAPFLLNSTSQYQILDVFSKSSGKKTITFSADIHAIYLVVLDNADVDIEFNLVGEGGKVDIYGIFFGNISSQVVSSLLASNTFANIHLFCAVTDGSEMKLDGSVIIGKDISNVEGYLQEEQLLLGTPKHLFVRPLLDVRSNQVKASHGSKIHMIDQQKLFYMMARGLDKKTSQKLVLQSTLQSFFDKIPDVDNESKNNLLQNLLSSILVS